GEKLSTLLGEDASARKVKSGDAAFDKAKNPELPRGVKHSYNYIAFRFLPDGSTNLPPLGAKGKGSEGGRWFITVHSIGDRERTKNDTEAPPDFFTWMVDPVSGTSKTFRPGLK